MARKREKRSPIRIKPLRSPGQSLQQQVQEIMEGRVTLWVLLAVLCVCVAILEWCRWVFAMPPSPVLVSFIAAMGIAFAVLMAIREVKRVVRLELGMEGERTVGQMLEEYRAFGYKAFHDIPEDKYNIDHVLVGPTGIYAIETKTRSKTIGHDARIFYDGEQVRIEGQSPDKAPVRQAAACADRVRQVIESATGERVDVRPVVLYPGWFVVREFRQADVWVLEPKALRGWIEREETRLSDEQVSLFAAVLTTYLRSRSEASR